MSETLALILALCAGILLGAIFFGGLWWTIQRAVSSKQPASWFFTSLLLRGVIVVTGFYFFSQGNWRRLLACFMGFLCARLFMMRVMRLTHMQKGIKAS